MLKVAKKIGIIILILTIFYVIIIHDLKIVEVQHGESGELITYKFFVLEYQYYIEY